MLYRGIAARSFERRFQLADHVEVNGAALKNGLLHIDLKRNIPEEMKPRKIEITVGGKSAKQIEAKAAKLTASLFRQRAAHRAPPFFCSGDEVAEAVDVLGRRGKAGHEAAERFAFADISVESRAASASHRSARPVSCSLFMVALVMMANTSLACGSQARRSRFEARIEAASRAAMALACAAVSSHSPSSK